MIIKERKREKKGINMTASQIKLQTEFVNGYVNDVTEMLCFVVMYTQKSKDYNCTSHTVRSLVKKMSILL